MIWYLPNGIRKELVSGGGGGATLADGNYIDITVSGSGTVMQINPGVVGLTEMADAPGLSVLGNPTSGSADPSYLTAATSGNILRRSGAGIAWGRIDLASADAVGSSILGIGNGGLGNAVTDPGADRILGWKDSIGQHIHYNIGSGLLISGSTLSATGTGISDGNKGDITVSGGGVTWTINLGAVTYAKLQNSSAGNVVLTRADAAAGSYGETSLAGQQLLGRGVSGNIAPIVLGANLSMVGTTLNASSSATLGPSGPLSVVGNPTNASAVPVDISAGADGNVLVRRSTGLEFGKVNLDSLNSVTGTLALANGGTNTALSSPGADRIMFWKNSSGLMDWMVIGSGLSLDSGTNTLSATGGGGGVTPGDKVDITVVSDTEWQINLNAVTNSELANMPPLTIKGNNTTSADDPFDLSPDEVAFMLPIFDRLDQGLVPPSGGTSGTTKFLREDVSWAVPTNQMITLSGDLTGNGTTSINAQIAASAVGSNEIANDAVTYAKLQNAANINGNVVLARTAASSGDYSEVFLSGSTLLGRGSAGNIAPITLGPNMTMTGTVLDSAGGGGGGSAMDAVGSLQYHAGSGAFAGADDAGSVKWDGTDQMQFKGAEANWEIASVDTEPWLFINRNGTVKAVEFGSGSSATPDLSLRRGAAETLEVVGDFRTDFANGWGIVLPTASGTPTDLDFQNPQTGLPFWDEASETLYIRGIGVDNWVAVGGAGAGSFAPDDAEYIVKTASGDLTAERVATDSATVAWDYSTVDQAKLNVIDASITPAKMSSAARKRQITFTAGNGIDDLALGEVLTARLVIGYGFTIKQWYLIADAVGSITLDLWGTSVASYPPTNANSFVGASKPSLSSAIQASSSTLTGWTTSGVPGAALSVEIESVSGIKWFQLVIVVEVA